MDRAHAELVGARAWIDALASGRAWRPADPGDVLLQAGVPDEHLEAALLAASRAEALSRALSARGLRR